MKVRKGICGECNDHIKQTDLIQSVADSLQYISYYHPRDYIVSLGSAYERRRLREQIEHKAAYLMAVGGAAYLVSKAIRRAKIIAFEDLGMEGIYEFEVRDMPVTVAVDAKGTSVHQTGPAEWQQRIAGIPILQ